MTDDSGCLRIIGHVTHRYYEPEALYFPKIEVRQVANSRSGEEFNTELELAINPWDLFATFGRDRRILSDDYIEQIAKREKIPSLLYINQFSYQTLRFRYEIDDFMNLMVKKVLLYKLEPYVLRYSSIVDGRRAMGSIRDGIYLLKVAVEKDYLDPAAKGIIIARDSATGKTRVLNGDKVKKKQYINGIKKLVRVQDGKVITPVEFSMRDLRLMRIRSNMIVQLETIDEKKLRKINVLHDQLKELVSPELEGNLRNLLAKELDDIAVNRAEMEDKKGRDEISASRYMRALMAPIQKYMNNLKNDNVSQGCREATEASPISSIEKCYDEYEFKQALPEDFFDKVRKLTIDAYRKNDLTYVSLAPLVDLDKLVENDSGLKARAFAGPVTLLLNSNQSYIRPLDNLDEAYCSNDDCKQEIDDEIAKLEGKEGPSEKEDNRYRDSPFFGSIKHLIKKKVDFFLDKMVDLEKAYRATNSVASLLYRYVIEANLQFVSLKDKSLEALDVEKCPSVGADMRPLADCLRPAPEVSTHLEDFLAEVNGENEPVIPDDYSSSRQLLFRNKLIDTKVLKSDLYKIIQSGDMNLEATKKLCEWYASRASDIFWTKMKSLNQRDGRSWFYYRSDQNLGFKQEILSDCVRKEIEHQKKIAGVRPNILERAKDYFWNPSEARGIFVERKLKVNRTGSYRFKGGKSMNISVSGTTEISSGEARQGSINY
ncbi:MAG: hypothetical protein KDD35_07530, partial [Bdellovibrionales bacterium]|nr:hypothetical protein [Bdellovibrionales bacterium]